MPETDLDLLIHAAQESGRIATAFVPQDAKRWDKADNAGPVTEADLAVNAYLERALQAARPDYGWLSEETEDNIDRLTRDRVFIVDPIDGTRSFIEGSRTWAHSIAIAQAGQVTAAVIYLPMLDKMYAAELGKGAALNGNPLSVSGVADLNNANILSARPTMDAHHWKSGTPAFERSFRPSLAYRLGLVAQGRFDGMLTLRKSWEWDIAAGALIVTEAGGQISDRTGAPLGFNNADPRLNGVVCAGASVHDALIGALAPSP